MARGLALAASVAAVLSGCVARAPRSRDPGHAARVVAAGPARHFTDDHCGPGSLSLVLNALGDPATAADVASLVPRAPGRGVLSVDLLVAARERGFEATLGQGDVSTLRGELDAGRPSILMLKLLEAPGRSRDVYHYVVVDGVDPDRALFRFQYGDGRFRWARLRDVEKSWKRAGHAHLRVRPGAAMLTRRAFDLEREGRLQEAREGYRRVVEEYPAAVRAWTNLGNVEAALGRAQEAEMAYRRALAVDPEHRDALNNLAFLLYEAGRRLEEAETLAARAATRPGPEKPLALDTLGRIQAARGRCTEAFQTFAEALTGAAGDRQLEKTRVELLLGRGEAERACGRTAAARASFDQALAEAEPGSRNAQRARAAAAALPVAP